MIHNNISMLLVKFAEMASLLREQTRVKESLEGALERQKEGTCIILTCTCILCCAPKLKEYVHGIHVCTLWRELD